MKDDIEYLKKLLNIESIYEGKSCPIICIDGDIQYPSWLCQSDISFYIKDVTIPIIIFIRYATGVYQYWVENELPHRIGGPAIIGIDQKQSVYFVKYYNNGLLHCVDGPAKTILFVTNLTDNEIHFASAKQEFFINGIAANFPYPTRIICNNGIYKINDNKLLVLSADNVQVEFDPVIADFQPVYLVIEHYNNNLINKTISCKSIINSQWKLPSDDTIMICSDTINDKLFTNVFSSWDLYSGNFFNDSMTEVFTLQVIND